jgi:hypothetical protein
MEPIRQSTFPVLVSEQALSHSLGAAPGRKSSAKARLSPDASILCEAFTEGSEFRGLVREDGNGVRIESVRSRRQSPAQDRWIA